MKNIHIGVYGICVQTRKILLIKKARWPYIGMYDLPWWGIEQSETVLDCLKRELVEEVNGKLIESEFIGFNEYHGDYLSSSGEQKTIHHIGFYYRVSLDISELRIWADGHDSLGAEWIDISQLDTIAIAPIAKPMILNLLQSSVILY